MSIRTSVDDTEILLAQPRGFCAGVDRAIEIVERALALFGAPIYVRHEIVHNAYVVEDLRRKGAVFIEELDDVPAGATLIFSAHGVSRAIRSEAEARGLRVFDATCPLVTKVHMEVAKMRADGLEIVMIGHKGHPEVEGTMGQSGNGMYLVEDIDDVLRLEVVDSAKLAFVTQTTLSVDDAAEIIDALKARFPQIREPKKQDICYATQNRQVAIKQIAAESDLVIVVGSRNSSNSVRLVEVSLEAGAKAAYLVDFADEIDEAWLEGVGTVGLTSGASVPEILVEGVLEWLAERGYGDVEQIRSTEEHLQFSLPKELRRDLRAEAAGK